MTVNNPSQDDGSDSEGRLADIPRNRLIEEVISRWNDIIRLEGDVAALRRRLREAELLAQGAVDHERPLHGELGESEGRGHKDCSARAPIGERKGAA